MARWDETPLQVEELFEDLQDNLETNDMEAIRDRVDDIDGLRDWLTLNDFDRRTVNRWLKLYAAHDEARIWQ